MKSKPAESKRGERKVRKYAFSFTFFVFVNNIWMTVRQMSSQTSAKQTNARTQRDWKNGCSKGQTVACRPNNQREFRHQRQHHQEQRRLKDYFILILWILQESRLIPFFVVWLYIYMYAYTCKSPEIKILRFSELVLSKFNTNVFEHFSPFCFSKLRGSRLGCTCVARVSSLKELG